MILEVIVPQIVNELTKVCDDAYQLEKDLVPSFLCTPSHKATREEGRVALAETYERAVSALTEAPVEGLEATLHYLEPLAIEAAQSVGTTVANDAQIERLVRRWVEKSIAMIHTAEMEEEMRVEEF